MLQISKSINSKGIFYNLSGHLDMSTAETFRRAVVEEQCSRGEVIHFDLSDLVFIDSSGIGELFRCYWHYSNLGIRVVFKNTNPDIEEVLDVIGFREAVAD